MNRPSRTTIGDVARLAEVSTATVSNVLNGTGRVSATVASRVRSAAEELRYEPSQAATSLRTGRSKTVGLVLPDITNPFFPKLAQDVERGADGRGYAVLLADSRGDPARERRAVRNLSARGADAILLVPAEHDRPLPHSRVPVVVLDRAVGPGCLVSDNAGGGHQVARHLLELGHRDFAILAGPRDLTSASERVKGMLAALAEAGVEVPAERVLHGEFSVPEGAAATAKLLAAGRPAFTALLATNDTLALGALGELQRAGVRVPEDVSISGFDDIPWAALSFPPLTTVHQDTAALAHSALAAALDGLKPSGAIPVQLVVRASTSRARRQA